MWSYIQYRRIGNQVLEETRTKSPRISNLSSHAEKGQCATESNTSQSKLEGDRPSAERAKQDHANESSNNGDNKSPDRTLVEISGEDDPFDPQNWPLASRCKNVAILALLVFVQAWAGSAGSMANSAASQEFHVSKVAENLSTAMYLFGIGSGALFMGPLSETVGRNPTYLVATFFYLLFVLGSALTPTFGGQVACRFFVGLFASATLAINGSSVEDQFRPVKRSFVFPIIAWANVAAPVIAPIAGGWIVSNKHLGWRWTEWITLIISGAAFLIAFLFLPETYLPVLLDWKAKHLRRVTGDQRYISEHEETSFLQRTKKVGKLPATFLGTEPVITVLGGYLVLLYILLFSSLSGFDYVFKKTYGLSTGLTGSCFGATAAGATTFALCAPGLYEVSRRKTHYIHGASIIPEFRLWPAMITAPFLPISLFWLGWANYASISIWCSLGACFLFGVVLIAIYISCYEYIIDSYGDRAAIALASITMVRYLIAGGMTIAARPMYEGIGVHWTLTLLACIAVLLVPAPFVFWKFGAKLRKRSPYAVHDDKNKHSG